MIRQVSELTYKILAFPAVCRIDPRMQLNTADCVNWAVEMIELGYESRSLFMLASIDKSKSYFEIADLVQKSVSEIGLNLKSNENEAMISYAAYYINQMAKGIDVRLNLGQVHSLCSSADNAPAIIDFSLLYWAWGDIPNHSKPEFNHYWPAASLENIEEIIINKAVDWLENHEDEYKLP